MNKKLLELLNAISDKKAEVKAFVSNGDLDAAKNAKEELKTLQEKFDLLKDLDEDDQPMNRVVDNSTPVPAASDKKDSLHEFANAVRNLPRTNMMQEGGQTGEDGGYTVPEDVQTKINHYKESHRSLRALATVENVTTNKGSRVYQKKADVQGFSEVDENGLVQAMDEPKFEQVGYAIKDYAGYLPVSNDLLNDSDANIEATIVDWVGRESLATDNKKILGLVAAKTATKLASGINGIKKEINVTLGSAYRSGARIVTNDDGLNYLDTLEDANHRPLLNPDPTEDNAIRLRVGATTIPVEVFPNADMPSEEVIPEGEEEATAIKIPFILGDLKEAFHIYDRQQTNLFASREASVSDAEGKIVYNAYAQRGCLYRADMRADYKTIDADAFVNGYIEVSLGE